MDDTERTDPLAAYVCQLVDARVAAALARALGTGGAGLISTTEAARVAAVSTGTIRRWLAAGRLSTRRAGRVLRVDRAELQALLAAEPAPRRPKLSPEELALRAAATIVEERHRRDRGR
jgi:excisionase family DNA binding protein